MIALSRTVKIKDVLFFSTLVLVSCAIHLIVLFAVSFDFGPLKKNPQTRRAMRAGLIPAGKLSATMRAERTQRRTSSSYVPRTRVAPRLVAQNDKQDPSENVYTSPSRSADEELVANEDAAPEAYSEFLKKLESNRTSSGESFGGDSYDVLEGGASNARAGQAAPGKSRQTFDPRVQMVVNSYPPTSIERSYSRVPYPNLKIDKKDYQKGWTSVYFQVFSDSRGMIRELRLLRPENPNDFEKAFVDAVESTIQSWKFDKIKAEIHVDVRFYVE